MSLVIPIRSSNAYVGIGKQSVGGTPVAPTIFPRWLDGTTIDITLKEERILEGDGTRRLSQVIKNQQMTKVKIVCIPRPIELGFFEAAALGINADTVTAAVYSSSVSAAHLAGDTNLVVGSVSGMPAAPTSLVYDPGSATEEIVQVTSNAGTSLTVLPLKFAHGASKNVLSPTTHVLTDQNDGNYYSVEVGLGSLNGAAGTTLRVRDCKLDTINRSAKAGQLLTYTMEFTGIASIVQGTPSTITLEAHNPFYYDTGVWNLDGSLTGDALEIETFALDQKNNLDTGIQSESLTLDATIFGAIAVTLTGTAVFTTANRLFSIYFGSSSGTTDAQAIYSGSLNLTFTQVDGFHALTYTITTLHYTKGTWPVPKADGKHYQLPFVAESVTNQGVNLFVLQSTVKNTQTTSY